MTDPAHLGEWLRLLSAQAADPAFLRRPAAVRGRQALEAFAKAAILAKLADITLTPIRVTDDGIVRAVRALDSVEYGFNRQDRTFYGGLREEDGDWLVVPATHRNSVILDPCLPLRGWRRRIRYTLRGVAFSALMDTLHASDGPLEGRRDAALYVLCRDVVDAAWCGLHMQRRLRELFPTKVVRRQIRKALDIDPGVLALARAARFRTRHHAMSQQWLSFVWQYRGPLERIRAQTPALLQTVAQHMFQDGVDPVVDPTLACRTWLLGQGMAKGAYKMLAGQSARPLREVVSRFHAVESLRAVHLALSLADTGHGVRRPRPLFYRVTFDQFGPGAEIRTAQERLAKVPRAVFVAAHGRFAEASEEAVAELALDYRAILDWWVESSPHRELARAGWDRWLDLARIEDARRRAAAEASSWPCAVEEMRTPDAEVLALATPLALFEEGRALRHCVHGYADRCHNDRVRLFSARLHHQGRMERATIALVPGTKGWRIWDIRGACNRRMGGHWIPLARELAETYSRQDGSGQLPLPIVCGFRASRARD